MDIHIEALRFETIIGLLPFERETPQAVVVDLVASYDYYDGTFLNYAEMVTLIQEHLHLKQYALLEDALLGLKATLISHFPTIERLTIKIAKPDILPQCTVALSQSWDFRE